jgi:hypothetical protein
MLIETVILLHLKIATALQYNTGLRLPVHSEGLYNVKGTQYLTIFLEHPRLLNRSEAGAVMRTMQGFLENQRIDLVGLRLPDGKIQILGRIIHRK